MAAEVASIPDPQTTWVRSKMTKARTQALVDCGLLRPKAEVEWRAAAGDQFPSKDIKEQVIFASFFERGFNLLVGDFFRGLLYYYNLEGNISSGNQSLSANYGNFNLNHTILIQGRTHERWEG
jgi:hypothetical protein